MVVFPSADRWPHTRQWQDAPPLTVSPHHSKYFGFFEPEPDEPEAAGRTIQQSVCAESLSAHPHSHPGRRGGKCEREVPRKLPTAQRTQTLNQWRQGPIVIYHDDSEVNGRNARLGKAGTRLQKINIPSMPGSHRRMQLSK